MQDQLNSLKYTSKIVSDDIKKDMLMKKVLLFVRAKEEHAELTKPQLCKIIGIPDSSLKRIMKDLNMKSFYRHEVPVNRKKIDLTINKKINKGTKKLSLRCGTIANTNKVHGFLSPNDIYGMEMTPIINYDNMLSDLLISV
jgi:hypothetical protein